MITGSKYGPANYHFQMRIDWTIENDPDVSKNQSNVTLKVYHYYPWQSLKAGEREILTWVGSEELLPRTLCPAIASTSYGSTLVATRTAAVKHDDDGTKTLRLAAGMTVDKKWDKYGAYIGWIEVVADGIVLEPIPRASSIASMSERVVVDGVNKWSITMSRKNPAFFHKATLKIGDNFTYETEPFATDAECAIPAEWINAIPVNTDPGTVSVSVQTYSDESCVTKIAEPVASTFQIVASEAIAAPVLSDGWVTLTPDNKDTAAEALAVYVAGYSKVKATFDSEHVASQYGADIAGYSINVGGMDYAASDGVATSGVLPARDTTVSCYATDTRGLRSSENKSTKVWPYSPPRLSGVSVYRCGEGGTAANNGTRIYLKATETHSVIRPDDKDINPVTLTARYRQAGSASWSESVSLTSNVGTVADWWINTEHSYEVQITAKDALGTTTAATYTTVIPTAKVTFAARDGGNGFGFGKYPEHENGLDVAWDIYMHDMLLRDIFYPVGSIFLHTNADFKPGEIIGGKWESLSGGYPGYAWERTE